MAMTFDQKKYFLQLLVEKRSFFYEPNGIPATCLSKSGRIDAWREIHDRLSAATGYAKDYSYLRDIVWPNFRKRTLRKIRDMAQADKQIKELDELDDLALQVLQVEPAEVLQRHLLSLLDNGDADQTLNGEMNVGQEPGNLQEDDLQAISIQEAMTTLNNRLPPVSLYHLANTNSIAQPRQQSSMTMASGSLAGLTETKCVTINTPLGLNPQHSSNPAPPMNGHQPVPIPISGSRKRKFSTPSMFPVNQVETFNHCPEEVAETISSSDSAVHDAGDEEKAMKVKLLSLQCDLVAIKAYKKRLEARVLENQLQIPMSAFTSPLYTNSNNCHSQQQKMDNNHFI